MDNINNDKTYGYIYKTTIHNPDSRLNGKYYIGQHKCKIPGEQDPKYFGSGTIIRNYIKNFGTDDLVCEVLCWGSSDLELNELELTYVNKNTLKDPLCLNLVHGGMRPLDEFWRAPSPEKREEANKKQSESMKKKHQDKEFHERWLEKNNTEERRQKSSEVCKKLWDDPEFRERHLKELQEGHEKARETEEYMNNLKRNSTNYYHEHPELQEKLRNGVKKKWEDEDYRKEASDRCSQNMRKYYSDKNNRDKNSKRMKEYLKNHPEAAVKLGKLAKEYFADPENRKKLSDTQKESYQKNTERRKKLSKSIKLANENPELKKRQSEAAKGFKWYNNGVENLKTKTPPPADEGWVEGLLIKNKYDKTMLWFNNGVKNTRAEVAPGPDWVPGRLKGVVKL